MFDPIDPRQSFPDLERGILKYWKEEDIFRRSLRKVVAFDTESKRQEEQSNEFSFYDGPPFATGLPHYGHLLAGTIKDVIPRYQTMKGKHVQRRFGWDTHGLPVEYEVEKEFGLDRDKIRAMGVKAFNDLCRSVVLRYTKEWRVTVERIGRWVDMDWDYRTMDPDYMESIWWVFKQLHEKKLVYEGYKPMHICPRCATPLSISEVSQGYKDRTDQSVIVTFPLVNEPKTMILAWTTTPWSLPGNLFLSVGLTIPYVRVKMGDITYIVAKPLVEKVFKDKEYEILGDIAATDLIGKRYTPLFDYFVHTPLKSGKPGTYGENAFMIVEHANVSMEEGTGIVHLTSSNGEDGFEVANKLGIGILHHVTIDGHFVPEVTDFAELLVKPEKTDDPQSTDKAIARKLKESGRLFSQYTVTHSYPHCWRCDTPLLNYATSSWFVSIDKIKADMIKANSQTEWVPAHLRDGRFGNWLENARDWSISRNRYWGTPIPLWRHEITGEIRAIGSRDELISFEPKRFTKLTVLRHGESEGNLIPIYQGKVPGTDLTDNGKNYVTNLALNFEKKSVHIIYASPLARAQQTAQILAKVTGAVIVTDERLREVDFGDYEGKVLDFTDLDFVKARRAHKLETNQIETIYHFPGMETWSQVSARVLPFLEEVLAKHPGEHVMIVTHADPMQHVRQFFTNEKPAKLCDQPYPSFATPSSYYWDHANAEPLDLHKEVVDAFTWTDAEPKDTVQLTVVRHGETEWNAEDRIGGSQDLKLSNKGISQAKGLNSNLKAENYDVILCSDLERARHTAELATKDWGKEIIGLPIFREQFLGEWEGKTVQEVRAENPEYPEIFLRDVDDPPGGEPKREFLDRIQEGLKYLEDHYKGKRVLLFSHRRWICGLRHLELGAPFWEPLPNVHTQSFTIAPKFRRVPDVMDCWFESGSMPYAQSHFPFQQGLGFRTEDLGQQSKKNQSLSPNPQSPPPGFPADFIAEGIDQTRGWFYTLTVLSAALFKSPAFHHCVVNGTVLAEDGKKMSKRLKNYPEPLEIVEKHGADAVRFALMHSPAVRGEDMRFSAKVVEEAVKNVLLPLWNTYSFFVTYANAAEWIPGEDRLISGHPLDRWILAEVQDLTNRMTSQLDGYDLSASCEELFETIDALTNWYVRLSRRRFAGRGNLQGVSDSATATSEQAEALNTLYNVLLTLGQLLAPFCPFITDAIYLNLTASAHGSVHLTQWPETKELSLDDQRLIQKNRVLRRIVSLGLKLRSEKNVKVRQPLQKALVALPEVLRLGISLETADLQLLRDELNVKNLEMLEDPATIAEPFVQVDARKVGPRMGGKVQELIGAGKRGEFTESASGMIMIMGEELTPDEAKVVYRGREGEEVAADHGIVVSIDTTLSTELTLEGEARDLIRAIQQERKDRGLQMQEQIGLQILDADDLVETFGSLIARETNAILELTDASDQTIELEERKVTVRFKVR